MISGTTPEGFAQLMIIELKQWQEVSFSPLADHVRTYLRGGLVDVSHPSYQSWSYSRLLQDFYQYVVQDPIRVSPSVYLHNCHSATTIKDGRFTDLLAKAPVFLAGEWSSLQKRIARTIALGDKGAVINRIEDSPVQVSKQLVEVRGPQLVVQSN